MSILSSIGRGFDTMIRARERHARAQVDAYLAQLDDEQLTMYGVDRKRLRKTNGHRLFI